jgi:SPP1 family predicted phage head-tail adaptor
MSLAAGRLRHSVLIEKKVTTRDEATGAPVTSWQPFLTDGAGQPMNVRAEVVPLSAKEFVAAQAVQSQITTRITIRYRPGLLASMRITFRGQIYNIAGALPDNLSGLEYITLPCSEGVNDG